MNREFLEHCIEEYVLPGNANAVIDSIEENYHQVTTNPDQIIIGVKVTYSYSIEIKGITQTGEGADHFFSHSWLMDKMMEQISVLNDDMIQREIKPELAEDHDRFEYKSTTEQDAFNKVAIVLIVISCILSTLALFN